MGDKPESNVWISGTTIKKTGRSRTIQTLNQKQKAIQVVLAHVHIKATRPTPYAPTTDYLIPQWVAHQNKLAFEHNSGV